jgi:biopolymer transport protein ExbB
MKKLHSVLVIALFMVSASAGAQTLEELAEIVRRAASAEGQINQEREAEFVRDRDNQRNLLAAARTEKRREEQRSDDLKSEYDRLERELAELTTVLQERMGNLGAVISRLR